MIPWTATWCRELTHWKRLWSWERLRAGEGDDEVVGWHHRHNGHGIGWTPGVGDGQGGLAWRDWATELNWTDSIDMCVEPIFPWHFVEQWKIHSTVYYLEGSTVKGWRIKGRPPELKKGQGWVFLACKAKDENQWGASLGHRQMGEHYGVLTTEKSIHGHVISQDWNLALWGWWELNSSPADGWVKQTS